MKCKCGNNTFFVWTVREPSWKVNEEGDTIDYLFNGLMQPDIDYYTCTECGKKYKEFK